jgi:hypothetical protein
MFYLPELFDSQDFGTDVDNYTWRNLLSTDVFNSEEQK